MGSQQSTNPSSMLDHYSKRFIISTHPLDPQQHLMFYMHQKLSDNKYILRIICTNDEEDKNKMEELICKKLALYQNLGKFGYYTVIPVDHYMFQHDKGYCNSFIKCYLLFNTHNSQPLTHILTRNMLSTPPIPFPQSTIYKGLHSLIQGLTLLKHLNHPHRHINCDTVYYSKQQNNLYLSDPWISPLTELHQQYYSPQKIKQMKNQIDKCDHFIADLWSIGIVGLRMTGASGGDWYGKGKGIDLGAIGKAVERVKDAKLRGLLGKLLSQNLEVRSSVFEQSKLITGSKVQLTDSSVTKTRNLTGKVASVRKSFLNQSRPVNRQVIQNPPMNVRYTDKLVTSHLFAPGQLPQMNTMGTHMNSTNMGSNMNNVNMGPNVNNVNMGPNVNNVNAFSKNKSMMPNIQMNARPVQLRKVQSSFNDKPQIDMTMPITPSNLISQQPKPHPYTSFPQLPPSFYNKTPILTPTTTYLSNQTTTKPYFPSPASFNFKIPNKNNDYVTNGNGYGYGSGYGSNSNLKDIDYLGKRETNYGNDKYLKHVISTPVGFQTIKSQNQSIMVSMSQGGLAKSQSKVDAPFDSFYNDKLNGYSSFNYNYSLKEAPKTDSYSSQFTFNLDKPNKFQSSFNTHSSNHNYNKHHIQSAYLPQPPPLPFSLSLQTPSQSRIHLSSSSPSSPSPNPTLSSVNAPTLLPTQKPAYSQHQHLRTNASYPSSQQFQSDHLYQNKILQNIKQLQNKVSQMIISSHLQMNSNSLSESSGFYRSQINGNIMDQDGRMVESVIVNKEADASGHSTVKAIQEQIKGGEDVNVKSYHSRQNTGEIVQNQQQQRVIIKQQDRMSPILVRQSQQSSSRQPSSSSQSPNPNQSIQFLNINESRQTNKQQKTQQNYQMTQSISNTSQPQEHPITPAKTPSMHRLEGNNLTIPEQSDEESMSENAESRYLGEYVEEVYENGGKYAGYVMNGMRNGNGTFFYKDGGYYEGRWKQNMMNGYGKLYYETGNLAYQGQWYQDQFHGRGTVYNDQPQQIGPQGFDYNNMNLSQTYWQYYEGDLSHDMKARYGKLMLSNGQYYQGQFKNDVVHGKGTFHRLNGALVKGVWAEGYFVKEI